MLHPGFVGVKQDNSIATFKLLKGKAGMAYVGHTVSNNLQNANIVSKWDLLEHVPTAKERNSVKLHPHVLRVPSILTQSMGLPYCQIIS